MVDHEDTISTKSTSPTPREQEAERKHVERMHFQEDNVRHTDQQRVNRREVRQTYATKNHRKKGNTNTSEPPAVGSHTTEAIHHRSQSEGGGKDTTYKEKDIAHEDNSNQSEDEDDLILGTPLGTYVLRTKGTKNNTGTNTPDSVTRDRGKSPQWDPLNEESSKQKGWDTIRNLHFWGHFR